jgi:hypothetical protein
MGSGLFDGFEGYRSVTDADLEEAVRHWLVALDTNVLLHLYNYQGQALDDFMRVFEALGDRLFVPHQVVDEFWRNRMTVLKENKGRHLERQSIEKAFDSIESEFARWYQRAVSREGKLPGNVLRELWEARQAVSEAMDELADQHSVSADTPTHADPVVVRLETLLRGKVGAGPSADDRRGLVEEGRRRLQQRRPPGYMDAEKNPDRAVGDFIVWHQVMTESRSRGLPVLFVTQDTKEDWWANRGTAAMRARPELVSEMLEFSGQRLIMVRTPDLLRLSRVLGISVNEKTLAEAESDSEAGDGVWGEELYLSYLDQLAAWPGHYDAFIAAIKGGGRIARTPLARYIGKRPRSPMKGTSVPYSTALRRMCAAEGLAPDDFEVPFVAHATDGWMDYFFIPDPHYEALVDVVAKHPELLGAEDEGADVEAPED